MILSLGFAQIPGIAIFFGLFMVYLGIRIAMDSSRIWMPKFLLKKKIPLWIFNFFIPPFLRFLKFMKRFSHPRSQGATRSKTTRIISGVMLALVGLALAASPPVPLSGWIACFSIFFLAIGLFNDDGLYIVFGIASGIFYVFVVLFLLNFCSVNQMIDWTRAVFHRT